MGNSEKLSRLVNEFGRECERRKLSLKVGKSEVMYKNGYQLHEKLNGESLEEFDYFKYLWSQAAADGGCERDVVHRMNEGYRAWGALKSVLNNREFAINAEGVIVKD